VYCSAPLQVSYARFVLSFFFNARVGCLVALEYLSARVNIKQTLGDRNLFVLFIQFHLILVFTIFGRSGCAEVATGQT